MNSVFYFGTFQLVPTDLCNQNCSACLCRSISLEILTTMRVYNDKRTFQRTSVQDFPLFGELEEYKSYLFNISSDKLDADEVDQVDVGYVGASNTKFYVRDSTQVLDAYKSRFQHMRDGLVLFIERKIEKRRAPKKRPIQQTPNVGKFDSSLHQTLCAKYGGCID